MRRYFGVWLALALFPATSHGITFTDQTAPAGVGDPGYGTGPAFGDYDGDGWSDLLVARFSRSQDALLYRNLGDGRFALQDGALEDSREALAGLFVDMQGDGDLDIFLLRHVGINRFYLNEGGTYQRVAPPGNVSDGDWATGAVLGEFDGDGEVDMFVTHRLWSRNRLYSAILTDRATDITDLVSTLQGGGDPVGAAAFDYDADGLRDLFVSNFRSANQLYRNLGNGSFRQVTEEAGLLRATSTWTALAADFDNDADIDLFLVNASPESGLLYENREGAFVDVTSAMMPGSTSGLAGIWADLDNDGDLDLLTADGMAAQVWRNDGDGFAEVSAEAYPELDRGRPLTPAVADYDQDGDVDVFLTGNNAPDQLLRNDTPATGHGLTVSLVSSVSGHSPAGTLLRARVEGIGGLTRDFAVGASIGIVQGDLMHLGTGAADRISELVVQWPSGQRQVMTDVPTGGVLSLEEPLPERNLAIARIIAPRLDHR